MSEITKFSFLNFSAKSSTYYFKFNEYSKEVKINEKNIKSFDN